MKLHQWPAVAAFALALSCASPATFGDGYIPSGEVLSRIRPGATTSQQLRELLGAPLRVLRFPASGLEAWEYEMQEYSKRVTISISVGANGVVRDIQRIRQDGGM